MTPDDRTWSFTHWKPKHWLDPAASISSKILGFDSAPLGDIGSLSGSGALRGILFAGFQGV